jgi:NhaP-type Na+/H+ or K+/H+ antiporter
LTLSTSLGFTHWLALVGVLLLALGFSSAYVQRLPISSSTLYLALGVVFGPRVLNLLELRVEAGNPWFERLTELAVAVALFISGLKLRLPLRHQAWAPVIRLAGPLMLLCIGGVAVLGHFLLGFSWPAALLLGAVLAPTDPVLAGAVSVSHAADRDRVRFALSGEAGLNDGTAFPFVVLALAWQQHSTEGWQWLARWGLVDLLWAVGAALLVGYGLGRTLGHGAIRLRSQQRDTEAPSDFVALALIALAYTAGSLLHAWSFLAVFAAGVGLRHAEVAIVADTPHPEHARAADSAQASVSHPPAEHLVSAHVNAAELEAPAVAAGVLVSETMAFGSTVEHILECLLVTLVGVAVGSYWDSRALPLGVGLFVVLRPLGAYALLSGTRTSSVQRLMIGWFGIRGIGSLYYLAYAQSSAPHAHLATELAGITVSMIALSILFHGSSATPLLNLYQRQKERRARPRHHDQAEPLCAEESGNSRRE